MAEVKFYQTPEFKKLNAQFRRKLRATGFVDLEDPESPDDPLPRKGKPYNRNFKVGNELQTYYDSCLSYFERGTFESQRHLGICRMHANGDSLREIASRLSISKTAVDYQIQKVKKRMYDGQSKD